MFSLCHFVSRLKNVIPTSDSEIGEKSKPIGQKSNAKDHIPVSSVDSKYWKFICAREDISKGKILKKNRSSPIIRKKLLDDSRKTKGLNSSSIMSLDKSVWDDLKTKSLFNFPFMKESKLTPKVTHRIAQIDEPPRRSPTIENTPPKKRQVSPKPESPPPQQEVDTNLKTNSGHDTVRTDSPSRIPRFNNYQKVESVPEVKTVKKPTSSKPVSILSKPNPPVPPRSFQKSSKPSSANAIKNTGAPPKTEAWHLSTNVSHKKQNSVSKRPATATVQEKEHLVTRKRSNSFSFINSKMNKPPQKPPPSAVKPVGVRKEKRVPEKDPRVLQKSKLLTPIVKPPEPPQKTPKAISKKFIKPLKSIVETKTEKVPQSSQCSESILGVKEETITDSSQTSKPCLEVPSFEEKPKEVEEPPIEIKNEVLETCVKSKIFTKNNESLIKPMPRISNHNIGCSCTTILLDTANSSQSEKNPNSPSTHCLENIPIRDLVRHNSQFKTITLYLTQKGEITESDSSFCMSKSDIKCAARKDVGKPFKVNEESDVLQRRYVEMMAADECKKTTIKAPRKRYYRIFKRRYNTYDGGLTAPVFMLGETDSGLRSRGEPQDFYQIRDENLRNGSLFEDPEFPANDSSLYFSRRADRHYEWLRPGDISDNPRLFVEGYSRFDVQQGELGDCWLLAAVANLTLYRRLFFQIVPDDQGFEEKYAGVFHFRFWQYGKWVDVVIDDRLPTYRGQLIYMRSTEENEFWSALLEKAYAKLNGSYEALKGGSACEAMEDFTGGVTEMYEMNASPPNLFKILLKAYERGSLMSGSLEPDPHVLEAETSEGLIRGHAYSITRVKYVDIETPKVQGKIPLLRLRNPWGNENEWTGPWCDRSPEWQYIPDHEKEELGLTFDNDGEFWMSFKDFQTHFSRLEICNLTPDSLTEEEIQEGHKKKWEMSVFEGDWVRGVTAGGCRNHLDTFWHNPQYRITLTDPDDDDEESKCTLIVALMQKHRRSKKLNGVEFLTIGFAVYYLPDPDRVPKPLDLNFFKYNSSVARSPSFINLREVTCRFRLPPGTYCIIPSTFDPNEEGEFLLRVFSEHQNNMEYGANSSDNTYNRPNPGYNPGYNPPGGGGGGGYGGYNYRPPSSNYMNYGAPPPQPSGYTYYPSGYQNYQQNYAQNVYRPPQYANPYPRTNCVPPPTAYPPPLPPSYSQPAPPPYPTPPYPTQPLNYNTQRQPPGYPPYGFNR